MFALVRVGSVPPQPLRLTQTSLVDPINDLKTDGNLLRASGLVSPAVRRTRCTRHQLRKAECLLPFVRSGGSEPRFFAPLQPHERIGLSPRERSGDIFHVQLPGLS